MEIEGREEIKVVELPTIEPPPWDESAELTVVGARVPRMDALEKVTGQARYTADIRPAGMGRVMVRCMSASSRRSHH